MRLKGVRSPLALNLLGQTLLPAGRCLRDPFQPHWGPQPYTGSSPGVWASTLLGPEAHPVFTALGETAPQLVFWALTLAFTVPGNRLPARREGVRVAGGTRAASASPGLLALSNAPRCQLTGSPPIPSRRRGSTAVSTATPLPVRAQGCGTAGGALR